MLSAFHALPLCLGAGKILPPGEYRRFISLGGAKWGPRCPPVLGSFWGNTHLKQPYCCLGFFAHYLPFCLLLFAFPWVALVKNHVIITSPRGEKKNPQTKTKTVYQTGKISKALVANKGCRTGAPRSEPCPGSAPVTGSDGKPTSTSLSWGPLLPGAAPSLGRRREWLP